jgi:hypothetical protein
VDIHILMEIHIRLRFHEPGKECDKVITPEEEAYILKNAYVPEHIVSLMSLISKGDPFLVEEHFGLAKDNWLILVGYPLDRRFSTDRSEKVIGYVSERFRPEILWYIGPEIPGSLARSCQERETDQYYRLDIEKIKMKAALQRAVEKASRQLVVERASSISKEHEALVSELLKREKLQPRVRELYRAMPDYTGRSSTALVLNARDGKGRLAAFYVVDLAAHGFATYLLGTHSKKNYAPHASDLLFSEMIRLTREHGKDVINLGLGVNKGIRRFKEKWGGVPFLNYEFCEHRPGPAAISSMIGILEGKL